MSYAESSEAGFTFLVTSSLVLLSMVCRYVPCLVVQRHRKSTFLISHCHISLPCFLLRLLGNCPVDPARPVERSFQWLASD